MELLISIAIIATLAAVSVISLTEVRENGRDTKRLNAVKQIQLAMELYRRDIGTYPTSLSFGGTLINPSSSTIIYLKKIPTNPRPGSTEICSSTEYSYESDGTYYNLEFCLEKEKEDILAGYNCASVTGISSGHCP